MLNWSTGAIWRPDNSIGKTDKIVFLESPSNPVLHLVDIQAVSALAHAAGAQVIVDNVFATPVFQSPLALGADIVTYSTTNILMVRPPAWRGCVGHHSLY